MYDMRFTKNKKEDISFSCKNDILMKSNSVVIFYQINYHEIQFCHNFNQINSQEIQFCHHA
jgi:hypothetical protein